ncbi:unnamed protein product [Adineta steineri]|uniref:PARP4 MVP-ID C-terminal domain-containing protein n=1 Tax=Adineta steineri TaxID=433720 RepID=A0A814Z6U7_9BILA|nr:unnamed protein product [Adineta steineri]
MTSNEVDNINGSAANNTADKPLSSIVETPLTDSLVNEIFHQQNSDGSYPTTNEFGKLFNVDFEQVKNQLKEKGLDSSISDEIHRLISTASILFYFLYHSQKTQFPVDIDAIKQFVSKARTELEGFSMKADPIMQTYIDKGELAVKYVIDTREKYANICNDLKLPHPTWESYIQHLMNLEKQE